MEKNKFLFKKMFWTLRTIPKNTQKNFQDLLFIFGEKKWIPPGGGGSKWASEGPPKNWKVDFPHIPVGWNLPTLKVELTNCDTMLQDNMKKQVWESFSVAMYFWSKRLLLLLSLSYLYV